MTIVYKLTMRRTWMTWLFIGVMSVQFAVMGSAAAGDMEMTPVNPLAEDFSVREHALKSAIRKAKRKPSTFEKVMANMATFFVEDGSYYNGPYDSDGRPLEAAPQR